MPHIKTASTRLFCRLDGPASGPVLVLAHALGGDHTMWDANVLELARHFRVLRYDSRGHGASDVPPGPCDIERLARDVVELIDALGIGVIDFCGLSLGGMVGMWLGANAGERIGRLVLANTSAFVGPPATMNARIEVVRAGGMPAVADTMIERWFTPQFRSAGHAAVNRVRSTLLGTQAAGYIACAQAVRDMDQRDLIARIVAPTLVIAGRHDPATPPEHARYLRDHIRGARLIELEAAHISNIEAGAEFDAALGDFLRRPGWT